MSTKISPHFSDQKLEQASIEDFIDVFEDRVRFWLLEPGKTLLSAPDGFIAAVSLLLTYFEAYAIYRNGDDSKGQSKRFFREAFIDVFGSAKLTHALLGRVADILYQDARCGFFHDGIFRDRVLFAEAVQGELLVTVPKVNGQPDENGAIESVVINPKRFYNAIESHFARYIAGLRDTGNRVARENFKKAVDIKWRPHTAGAIVGMDEEAFAKLRR